MAFFWYDAHRPDPPDPEKDREVAMKRILSAAAALALVCLCASAAAYSKNGQGLYVDASGQVIADLWDDAAGLYIVNGVGYPIENSDSGASSSSSQPSSGSSSGAITVNSSDGATDPTAGLQKNPDGSVTVQSGQVSAPDEEESSPHLTQEEWAARWAKYAAKNGVTTGTVFMDGLGNVLPAEILELGLARSTILVEGKTMTVPTVALKWDTEAPEDKVLAVATPSKQTYLTLRAKKSQKSFVMGHCEKCRVVRVISTGKTWTFVDDGGVRAYVLTSGLTFYANEPRNWVNAIITVKGKTPRGNYVHFRCSPSSKAKQSAKEYPVGTSIAVFSQEGEWSEIEVDGYHCWMLSKFVTLTEPLITADAAPES